MCDIRHQTLKTKLIYKTRRKQFIRMAQVNGNQKSDIKKVECAHTALARESITRVHMREDCALVCGRQGCMGMPIGLHSTSVHCRRGKHAAAIVDALHKQNLTQINLGMCVDL